MTYPDDVVEKALDAHSPEWRMKDKVGQFLARTQMRHALAAAEAAMTEHKRVTCTHTGWTTCHGSMSSDGSGSMDYRCTNCGKRWHEDYPARVPTPPAASTGRG